MDTPAYFIALFTLGSVGCLDEMYYHLFKFQLFKRIDCYEENLLHMARSFVYSFIFIFVALFEVSGAYAWLVIILLALDIIVGIWDVIEEPHSRRNIGGLPAGEYLLHMLLSANLGVFYILYLIKLVPSLDMATSISRQTFTYPILQYMMVLMGLASMVLFIYGLIVTTKTKKLGKDLI